MLNFDLTSRLDVIRATDKFTAETLNRFAEFIASASGEVRLGMRSLLLGILCLGLVACGMNVDASVQLNVNPTIENVIAHYQKLTLLTPTPLVMQDNLGLCRLVIPGSDTYLHAPAFQPINIYVNEPAIAVMANNGERIFPVGSVVVKEKIENATPDSRSIIGLGIMIKRAKGFNPAGGDWEYAYWEDGRLSEQKELSHCQACHAAGVITDEWRMKYPGSIVELAGTARDSIFLTLPAAKNP